LVNSGRVAYATPRLLACSESSGRPWRCAYSRIELRAVAACFFVRKGRKGRKESQYVSSHEVTHGRGIPDLVAPLSFAFFASIADKCFDFINLRYVQ
jgi:hypothetical protein